MRLSRATLTSPRSPNRLRFSEQSSGHTIGSDGFEKLQDHHPLALGAEIEGWCRENLEQSEPR